MRFVPRASGLVRAVVLLVTIALAAAALTVGRGDAAEPIMLEAGQPSPQTFLAVQNVTVVDQEATEAAREAARLEVPHRYAEDTQAREAVLMDIQEFFDNAQLVATPVPSDSAGAEVPPATEPLPEVTIPATEEEGAAQPGTGEEPAETTSSTTTTTIPPPPPRNEQVDQLSRQHPLLKQDTVVTIVGILNDDFERAAQEEEQLFGSVETEALTLARELLERGIISTDLESIRTGLVTSPPPLIDRNLRDLGLEDQLAAQEAVADLVANSLQANFFRDDAATQADREAAAEAVPEVTVAFVSGGAIVRENDIVTPVHLEAITEMGLLDPGERGPRLPAMGVVAALIVLLAAFYLWRIAPQHWSRPKMVTLFGLLVVLAALTTRLPEVIARDRVELGYLLPMALFGYLAASLFESRTAVLMALPVGTFTALATSDLGLVIYAIGATLAPIPLVSAVSSRTQLRLAVTYSALLHAPLAAAVSWFFNGWDTVPLAAAMGFGGGLAAGVAALGILPFLENIFRITTTVTLLDLIDRNHPALRLLEEKAPGTFNHSLLLGTLAGKAARAIDGNPLLAQAMAYYHDLGKTERAQYFIENQFGVSNPHDQLPAEESVAIIRGHVSDGLELAREFRIPPDVAQGIVTHHGTGLMRYFYHKALEENGNQVDPADFRHQGEKPESKEMVILMLSDVVEAATRSLVQHEDPTSESIRKVVEQVIDEKVEDGQLEEGALTFGELTRVKEAFVDALIGYYHTRIPYPGFPEGRNEQPA